MHSSFVTGTMPAFTELAERFHFRIGSKSVRPLIFLDTLLRGVSYCMFLSNPLSGLLMLLAVFAEDRWIGGMAVLGLLSATLMAVWLGVDQTFLKAGLYSFSGFLTGAAVVQYGNTNHGDWYIIFPVVLLSMFTVFIFAAFVTFVTVPYGVPPLGIPFAVVVTLWLLSCHESGKYPTNLYVVVRIKPCLHCT